MCRARGEAGRAGRGGECGTPPVRGDTGLDWAARIGDGKKWIASDLILEIESTGI